MLESSEATAIATSGGGAAALLAVVYTLRKIWRQISQERVDTSKDSAETSLISTLQEQIERNARDIIDLKNNSREELSLTKKAFDEDRLKLHQRIEELQDEIRELTCTNEQVKREALEAYMHLASLPDPDPVLKEKLMKIIVKSKKED